jgi:predicted restriction endonuclease
MSLLAYEQTFANLKMNQSGDETSPHKVAMLLAVIELFEDEHITGNILYFDDKLKAAFKKQFESLAGPSDRCDPHLPYFHLRSSDFWFHQIKPGQYHDYGQLNTANGQGVINKHIAFVYLEDELYELLSYGVVRGLLKHALYENLTNERRTELLTVGKGWNWLETEATVQDYFAMLTKEINGEKYNKAQHRRTLLPKLMQRSEGAIEFKHQNISAVLIEMGQPYITGYKPAFNVQGQLKNVVLAHLAAHQNQLDNILLSAETSPQAAGHLTQTIQWQTVLDNDIPERISQVTEPPRKYLARKTNYTQRESNNRRLGEQGEAFVIEYERQRLIAANRADLAQEVQWSSQEKGDGLGYDVRSFQWLNEQPIEEVHYIEVKTTNSGKYQPFYISENERAYSKQHPKNYSLYRVYDFNKQSRIFQLHGAIDQHVHLSPQNYRAGFN